MLTLCAQQMESLWDEVLPVQVRELPEDLTRLDRVLSDGLLWPIAQAWGQTARERGRPSIAMATFVRLMVIKQRTGWGYETLVREVSDSLHLRRFCLIGIDRRVPDESTVRKLARRLGPEVVDEITRMVIETARRETRFVGRAARIDSTVVEADIRYPSDAMLALQGARALARKGRQLSGLVKSPVRVRDRSRSIGKAVRAISRTLATRTGQAKEQVMALNEQAGQLIARSAREAQRLAAAARASARGRGAESKLRAARQLDELAGRCRRVAEQIDRRARGLKISDRLVSISDPDARHVLELRPDIVKVDRSLARGLADDRARRVAVTAFVSMAEDLRSTVIAEGVENPADYEAVCDLRVHGAQGYLLGRPSTHPRDLARLDRTTVTTLHGSASGTRAAGPEPQRHEVDESPLTAI